MAGVMLTRVGWLWVGQVGAWCDAGTDHMLVMRRVSLLLSPGEEDQGHLPRHEHVQPGRDTALPHRRVLVPRGGP